VPPPALGPGRTVEPWIPKAISRPSGWKGPAVVGTQHAVVIVLNRHIPLGVDLDPSERRMGY
jgi:hypothetical protein